MAGGIDILGSLEGSDLLGLKILHLCWDCQANILIKRKKEKHLFGLCFLWSYFPPHDVDAVQASNQLERSSGFIDIRIPFE